MYRLILSKKCYLVLPIIGMLFSTSGGISTLSDFEALFSPDSSEFSALCFSFFITSWSTLCGFLIFLCFLWKYSNGYITKSWLMLLSYKEQSSVLFSSFLLLRRIRSEDLMKKKYLLVFQQICLWLDKPPKLPMLSNTTSFWLVKEPTK